MLKYGNLNLKSDFDIRTVRDDEFDIDLFIDLQFYTLDIPLISHNFIISRLQYLNVRAILIRLCKKNTLATIHIMKDIDLFSAICNFEIDYNDRLIDISLKDNKAVFSVNEK